MNTAWLHVPFEEAVSSRGSGTSGLPKKEWQDVGRYAVIGQGAEEIEGWSDRDDLALHVSQPVVLYGGHTRRAKYVKETFVPGPNVKILKPRKELDARFLFYFLIGLDVENKGYADHFPLVRKSYIPLPSLEEQKRIVAVLDQAFAALDRARAHAEANLADAEELLENGVNEIFTALAGTSTVMSLADAVHPDCKLSYGIVQPGDEVEGGLPVVRPVDLKKRILSTDGLKRISPDRAEGYARTRLVGGELLLCVRGSTGEMSVASAELADANVTRGIVPIRFPDESVLPEFAYFQLRSRYAQDQIAAGTYGAALMQINIKDLRKLQFIVPSIEVQHEIISRAELLYERAGSLRDLYATKLNNIADLRQSLLQKAFSGQLI
ncbi:restriction endonuclease subunit S [uncultured Jannaschia sp.]|uniref:restriction endonuclease subunit S n=1 Tax=uncultured Jannaschia sp. TaxID=293347 RepID=UPI00262E0DF4|nr:restriction endonuclease subunit S [uncultured Jannaschia sp.]